MRSIDRAIEVQIEYGKGKENIWSSEGRLLETRIPNTVPMLIHAETSSIIFKFDGKLESATVKLFCVDL